MILSYICDRLINYRINYYVSTKLVKMKEDICKRRVTRSHLYITCIILFYVLCRQCLCGPS